MSEQSVGRDLTWWTDPRAILWLYDLGGIRAQITEGEAKRCDNSQWRALVDSRVAPLVWHSMPGHE